MSCDTISSSVHVEIVEDGRLSLDKAVEWVECTASGAIATFSGVVRDNSQGRGVDHLEYEAYVPMALKIMRSIGESILKEKGVSKSSWRTGLADWRSKSLPLLLPSARRTGRKP